MYDSRQVSWRGKLVRIVVCHIECPCHHYYQKICHVAGGAVADGASPRSQVVGTSWTHLLRNRNLRASMPCLVSHRHWSWWKFVLRNFWKLTQKMISAAVALFAHFAPDLHPSLWSPSEKSRPEIVGAIDCSQLPLEYSSRKITALKFERRMRTRLLTCYTIEMHWSAGATLHEFAPCSANCNSASMMNASGMTTFAHCQSSI